MLQIISGKFFKQKARYRHEGKGVVFSNYKWYGPIETCVATLDITDAIGSVSPCVISYLNQIEKSGKKGPGVLIRTGDWEILEQFRLICIVGFSAMFHKRRDVVSMLCRTSRLFTSDIPPSLYIPRFFQPSIQGTPANIAFFRRFVKHLIGLPRGAYLSVLAAMRGMASALEIVGENVDLAYSLLVFSLESLCQKYDSYEVSWQDYPDTVACRLNLLLSDLKDEKADKIRSALLRNQHLKLKKRFVEFAVANTKDSFFESEARGIKQAIGRSDLAPALRNAYDLRSSYAHELDPIHKMLRSPNLVTGEVHVREHEPYLTLAGLTRIVRHVIRSFVLSQQTSETEEIDWRKQLPGVILMPLAPTYWISEHTKFQPADATKRLEGFLQEVEAAFRLQKPLTGLKELMETYEALLPQVSKPNRLRMIALYCAYNALVEKQWKAQKHEATVEKYEAILKDCSIESVVTVLVLGNALPWTSTEMARQWTAYEGQRTKPKGLRIPRTIELLILIRIAEAYLAAGSTQRHSMWLNKARLNAAGCDSLQELVKKAREERKPIDIDEFWKVARKAIPDA